MSIAVIDRTAERLKGFSVDGWFFVGHSMGGMSNLELISRHDIKAQTEIMPMSDVNLAIAKLKENKARYRMVLKN